MAETSETVSTSPSGSVSFARTCRTVDRPGRTPYASFTAIGGRLTPVRSASVSAKDWTTGFSSPVSPCTVVSFGFSCAQFCTSRMFDETTHALPSRRLLSAMTS